MESNLRGLSSRRSFSFPFVLTLVCKDKWFRRASDKSKANGISRNFVTEIIAGIVCIQFRNVSFCSLISVLSLRDIVRLWL